MIITFLGGISAFLGVVMVGMTVYEKWQNIKSKKEKKDKEDVNVG